MADKAYDSKAIRSIAEECGASANILAKKFRKDDFIFSQYLCGHRNLIEHFFRKIKQFRGLATCYYRQPVNYLAAP